jgi:hypothetical protein
MKLRNYLLVADLLEAVVLDINLPGKTGWGF